MLLYFSLLYMLPVIMEFYFQFSLVFFFIIQIARIFLSVDHSMIGLKFAGGPCGFPGLGSGSSTPSITSFEMLPVFAISLKMYAICWYTILGCTWSSMHWCHLFLCSYHFSTCSLIFLSLILWMVFSSLFVPYHLFHLPSSLEHIFKIICYNLYLFLLTCCYSIFRVD